MPSLRRCCRLAALCWVCAAARGQTALNDRVMVVYNSGASHSAAVASYYMARREIPEANRCKISVSSTDIVARDEYAARIQAPLRKCLDSVGRQKILYIVLAYGTPYVLKLGDRSFALDQFVADVWDDFASMQPGPERGNQPYFGDAQSQGNIYQPFVPLASWRAQPRAPVVYSVWRLDAATPELAKGLVDKAMLAEKNGLSGKGCFDLQYGPISRVPDSGSASGDWDVHQSAELARNAGFEVVEDEQTTEFGTPPSPARCDGAALYAGWYSLNHYNDAFTWNPGAIGLHLDSASALDPRGGTNWAANAVKHGITITSGAVAEPFLAGLPHPDQVFLYLFMGANAGDALLRATRWLKWMVLNIGDPLYRPFPKGAGLLAAAQAAREIALALAPAALAGGDQGYGIVALGAPAPPGGTRVALTSERPDAAAVPPSVLVPEKAKVARFPVSTRAVSGDEIAVRISVAAGAASKSNTLVLFPLLASVTISPATVQGGEAATGTVRLRHAAPPGGIAVSLAGQGAALTGLPAEVKVPAGASSATFPVATLPGAAPAAQVVTASYGGASRTATLTVAPSR